MPNRNTPASGKFTGLFKDQLNGRIELYYNGTLIWSDSATTITRPAGITETNAGSVSITGSLSAANFTATAGTVGTLSVATMSGQPMVARLGSAAAIASNGADAILTDVAFVAPKALQIISAWAYTLSSSEVTKGTATTSASYRRTILVTNTAGTGTGTDIVASLNATTSLDSRQSRVFTIAASTVPAGAVIIASQLTVGAQTADGTDNAARIYEMSYQYV